MGTQGFGLLGIPKKPGKGLLKPVIWDRVRRESRQGQLPFEGAGGRGGSASGWTPTWRVTGNPGGTTTRITTTPSGREVQFNSYGDRTNVVFYGNRLTKSTKEGIGKLSDVYRAVKSYVETFKPKTLEFSAASSRHQKVYDRVVPQIARELKGTFEPEGDYDYTIEFPD